MTTKEAIAMLRRIQDPEPYEPRLSENAVTALGMGIKALEETTYKSYKYTLEDLSNATKEAYKQGKNDAWTWHRFCMKFPEDNKPCLVTVLKDGERVVEEDCYYRPGGWVDYDNKHIAWMRMPEPYKGDEE